MTIKNTVPTLAYLPIAILASIYFIPVKLFLGNEFLKSTPKRRILVALSYFIVSNIIALSALIAYQADLGFIRIAILIYSMLNLAFLFYFHMTESGSYNLKLTCWAVILTSSLVAVS